MKVVHCLEWQYIDTLSKWWVFIDIWVFSVPGIWMYLAFIRAENLPIKGEMFDETEQEQKHNKSMKYWLIKNGIPMSIGDFKIPYDPG